MYRILIPATLLVWVSLSSRAASAQPLSVANTLPVVAALLGLAVLAAALYVPRRSTPAPKVAPVEGKDFIRLRQPQPAISPRGTEIVVVFSYDDPDSYALEPLLARWAREFKGDINLVRVPAVGGSQSHRYARAYYTAETLGSAKHLHGMLFDAVHVARRDLSDEDRFSTFFASHGIDPTTFRRHFHSSGVQTALHKAELLCRGYELDTASAIIVNGTHKITPQQAGSVPRMLELLDHLVAC